MLLNGNSVTKKLMNSVCTLCLSIVPIDFQDGVNELDVGVNESMLIFLSMLN